MIKSGVTIRSLFSAFVVWSSFVIRISSFVLFLLPFVHNQFVSVRIAKLRHPAHRCLKLFDIEADAALLQLGNCCVDILHFKGDSCSVARRFPSWMTTDPDCCGAEIVLDPGASHRGVSRL